METNKMYDCVHKLQWISYVVPYKNTYTQARFLLTEHEIGGLYVFIAAWDEPRAAANLHIALDTLVQREFKNLRRPSWIPSGIITCTTSCLCVRENYAHEQKKNVHVPIMHISASANPKKQAVQLLSSGIASNRYVLVRAIDTNKRALRLVDDLITYLNDGIMAHVFGGKKYQCPVPCGILLYTTRCLRSEHVYKQALKLSGPS